MVWIGSEQKQLWLGGVTCIAQLALSASHPQAKAAFVHSYLFVFKIYNLFDRKAI
jgi:hypothetical protein